jgi:uncharacterized membrane protein
MKQRKLYAIAVVGGVLGMVAAFLQTLEKLTLLQNSHAVLTCNFSSVFSCTNVLNSWQSSVFGFPNSIMCLTLFTIFTVAAVAGLSGSKLSRGFRLGVQFLALATLGFALWYFYEEIYVIKSLCVYCLFCFAGLLAVNAVMLRLNAAELPIGVRGRATLARVIGKGGDVLGWFLLAALVAFAMVLRFA